MKNLTITLILMILSSSILLAQSNADADPNAVTNPHATTFTDDLFDHQFDFICGDASGEAGIETNGNYIYTSLWNSTGFCCYEMDGTFLGTFQVPGESAVRDLAYDGTYFYGAAASTQLFEMDFVGQSGTLISTLNAAVDTRAIAYDPYYDGFWGNNWSTPITLYDRSGNIIRQFDCGAHESYYGFAYTYITCEGLWLYGFAQSGGINSCDIVQIDPETGEETGIVFDAIGYSTTGTGIAGGLAIFDTYAPGWCTLLGIIQNETIFGIDGGGEYHPASITWHPTSFTQTVVINGTAQDFLNIISTSCGTLEWNIEVVFPEDFDSVNRLGSKEIWLIVDPIEGILASGASEIVTLDFNADELEEGIYYAEIIIFNNSVNNPEVIIPVTMFVGGPPELHFNFEGGDPSSPLWTIYIAGATISETDADLVAGDEIAIFDGGLMVGAFTLNQVCTPTNQFENELTAFSVLSTQAGYQSGNEFAFKCWDASEQVESDLFIYEFFDPYGDAYTGDVFPEGDGNYSIAEINFLPVTTQQYNLSVGYQFISSNVIPDDPDMMLVLSEILNDNLDFVRNTEGQMLRKIGDIWVNGIGDWIVEEGYLIRMFNEDSFSIEGLFVDPETQIPLTEGYQIVSYLPSLSVDALTAFQSIIGDNLDFIRNSNGQTLHKIGPHWINGIGNCTPGEGYLIKMFADDILIYATLYPFTCGGTFSDPRDGQVYNTVLIDYKCWMAENLNIGTMINGIEDMTDNSVIEKYCYDNDPANCEEYGGLYQWNEMMQYTANPWTQGICPEDWHLPGDYELYELENYLDPSINNPNLTGWRGTDCGLKMLEGGSSGFEALLAGQRKWDTGEFLGIGEFASFWSSVINPYNQVHSWFRSLNINNPKSYRNGASKFFGSSVRCVWNDGSMKQPNQSSKSLNKESGKKGQLNQNFFKIPTYFNLEEANPIEPVWTIYLEKGDLNIGDEIAVYDREILAGAGIIVSENIFENAIPVFSNLYKTGNKPIIKAWIKNENKEYILNDYTFSNPYGDAWTENVFPAKDGEYSLLNFTTTGISDENVRNEISIYPNPTTGIITIGNLTAIENFSTLEITDITGKTVFQTCPYEVKQVRMDGSKIEIDLSWLETGVYFINLSGKDLKFVSKIVIQ